MNSYVQVFSFLVSFIYGVLFYLFARFNRFMISNKNNAIKLIVTFVFVIDMVILYIYLMYKINFGIIHPYFVMVVVLGFFFMLKMYSKCKNCVKKIKFQK